MASANVISLEGLVEEPYAKVLCYPKAKQEELERRLKELKELDVRALEFVGRKSAFNVPVLGKGYVGIVVIAHAGFGRAALKIRRTDASREGMQREAEALRKANEVSVGPRLCAFTDDFILMEFIEGDLLPEWIKGLKGRGQRALLRLVLRDALEQCWRLDGMGLDHGELSRAPKHVIVERSGRPRIIDFESASLRRRPSNVTSLCQYLYLGSQLAKAIRRKLGGIDEEKLLKSLRAYKEAGTRESFEEVLRACKLQPPKA